MSPITYVTYRDGQRYVFNDVNKVDGKIFFSSGFDDESTLPPDSLEIAKQPDTLVDILARAGYSPERITQIVKEKYENFERLDSVVKSITYQDYLTQETKTSVDGSLVSNSAQALKNNTTYQNLRVEIEKNRNILMSEHNELLKKSLQVNDNQLIMQSQIYTQMIDFTSAINALTTATINQNLSPTFQAGQTSINIDTKAIADSTNATNQALVQSIASQATAIANQTNVIKTAEDAKLVEMKNHIEAVKAQKFDASFGDVSVTMSTEVLNANTQKTAEAIEKIAQANEKIALGQENQIQTNTKIVENIAKKNEHLDYLKNGDATIKDSNGNVIKPREVEAKKNAEQLIEQSDTNNTTFDDIADFVGEALGTVQEGLENALGSTDGFDLDFNPMSYVDNILKTDMEEYIEKLKKS